MARSDSERLLIVGCGAQSPYLIAATLYAMPQIRTMTLVNPHHPEKAGERSADIAERVKGLLAK